MACSEATSINRHLNGGGKERRAWYFLAPSLRFSFAAQNVERRAMTRLSYDRQGAYLIA